MDLLGRQRTIELSWVLQADITKQIRRTLSKLIQESSHGLFGALPIIFKTMEMQDILLEFAPQFFDGIGPGGIGG